MRLIRGLTNLKRLVRQADSPLAQGSVVTIGNFDGVHLGHQTIISQVREKARAMELPSVVMIFEPQPREYFEGDAAPPRLMGFRQKFETLLAEGIDIVLCLRFDDNFRRYSAMRYIDEVLVQGLKVRHLVVGDDFRFGCDRSGDFTLLRQAGVRAGFTVESTRTVIVDGERVSSTRIRNLLTVNSLHQAEALLGRPYRIRGRVVYGRQLGRDIGARTANILLPRMPALQGVYVVAAELDDGRVYDGVANIGVRPTVDGRRPALEVHLFGFTGTLYGQHITVSFRHGLREERKFASIEALQEQIALDLEEARAWIHRHGSARDGH